MNGTLDWTAAPAHPKNFARGPVAAVFNTQTWSGGVSSLPGSSDPSTGAIGKNWAIPQNGNGTRQRSSKNVWFVLGLLFVTMWLESGKRGQPL